MPGCFDLIRSRPWPVPGDRRRDAAATGFLLPHFEGRLPTPATEELFGGRLRTRRGVLDCRIDDHRPLTFSLTLVTRGALASGQFSPRLLRTFARDRVQQRTLAPFVATFVYALTVRVERPRDGQADFIPQVSVSLAYPLALVDAVTLRCVFWGTWFGRSEIFFLRRFLETVQADRSTSPTRCPASWMTLRSTGAHATF